MGLSHLKIKSWGPLNRFFSTRLPNTDFPVVCYHFVSPGHTSYCQGHIYPFSSSMSSVIRRRRLEAKIIYEHWTLVLYLQGISRGLQLSLVFGGLFSSRPPTARQKRPLRTWNTAGDAWERGRQSVMQSYPAVKIISLFLFLLFLLFFFTLFTTGTCLHAFQKNI